MSFNGIEILIGYTWKMTKIYYGSDWPCFLGVSYQTIVTVTFNMIFYDGRLFYRSQKDHNIIYLWGSMALKLCLVKHEKWPKIYYGIDW